MVKSTNTFVCRHPKVPYSKQMTMKSHTEVVDLYLVDPSSNAGRNLVAKWKIILIPMQV